jgi:TonB family protein
MQLDPAAENFKTGIMITWIIEPAISLSFFYLAYLIFLRNFAFFHANRLYLLTAIVFSLALPHISLTPPVTIGNYSSFIQEVTITAQAQDGSMPGKNSSLNTGIVLRGIYLAVAVLLAVRLLARLIYLAFIIARNRVTRYKNCRIVNIKGDQSPFSFINFIFINVNLYGKEEKKKIIEHELVHIRQFHSIDLILLEVLTIIQWFNPVAWLLRRSMQEIHEFLADEQLIKTGTSIPLYQSLLVHLQIGNGFFPLANNFNKSLTLSRIRMMTRMKPPAWKKLKVFILLPALIILVFMCTKIEDQLHVTSSLAARDNHRPAGSPVTTGTGMEADGVDEGNPDIAITEISPEPAGIPGPEVATRDEPVTEIIPETEPLAGEAESVITDKIPEGITSVSPAPINPSEAGNPSGNPDGRDTGTTPSATGGDEVFFIVEEMPDFKGGGQDRFRQYISENLRYPQAAADSGIHGRVFVQFVVQADGTVADARIVRGINPLLDREALRVVMESPGWNPGRQRGQPVAVAFTFPINFILQPRYAGISY